MGNDPVNNIDPDGGETDPKPGDLNKEGTHQWGLNGITGKHEWVTIMQGITVKPPIENHISYFGNTSAYKVTEIIEFTMDRTEFYVRGSKVANVRPIPQNPIKNKSMYDCSGWVSFCIGQYHKDLAKKLGGGTDDYIYWANKEKGLRKVEDNPVPKIGDIALWKGHVAFVVAVHGTGFTISHSSGKEGVTKVPKITTFKNLNDNQLKYYGTGGGKGNGVFVGFWTPKL